MEKNFWNDKWFSWRFDRRVDVVDVVVVVDVVDVDVDIDVLGGLSFWKMSLKIFSQILP